MRCAIIILFAIQVSKRCPASSPNVLYPLSAFIFLSADNSSKLILAILWNGEAMGGKRSRHGPSMTSLSSSASFHQQPRPRHHFTDSARHPSHSSNPNKNLNHNSNPSENPNPEPSHVGNLQYNPPCYTSPSPSGSYNPSCSSKLSCDPRYNPSCNPIPSCNPNSRLSPSPSGSSIPNSSYSPIPNPVPVCKSSCFFRLSRSPSPNASPVTYLMHHMPVGFLENCSRKCCERTLKGNVDIFMYRGDKAFCSAGCRYRQMIQDELMENGSLTAAPTSSLFPDCNGKTMPSGTIATA